MTEKSQLIFFVLLLTFTASNSAKWSTEPPDNSVLYACAQGTISIPWTVLLSPGDVIRSVHWLVQGLSEELLAAEVRGHFLPMPTFAGRVSKGTNAGLTLDDVQLLDSGNYSVEVIVKTTNGVVSLLRAAKVHVSDDLQTADGELHARQLPVAEYNSVTEQHHVVLTCGNFTYPSRPAFEATWQTPSENTLASSGYRDNHFYLLLPNPVEGGVFSCHVPAVQACIHGNSSTNASVPVDKVEARFAALDSEVRYLQAKKERPNTAVSFHARLINSATNMYPNYTLTFPDVATNVGNGYDPNTSKFAAPYNATYFFIATTQPYSNSRAFIALVVDDTEVARAVYESSSSYSPGMLTVHAVVHLAQGQMVWVNVVGSYSQSFLGGSTSFSGLLIDITP